MQKKTKKALKNLVWFMMGVIFFVAGAYVSLSMIVYLQMKQYVGEKYSSLDLKIGMPIYNFLDGDFWAIAKSKTSMDTKFNISYWDGKVQLDDYEFAVLGKKNTFDRLSAEYTALAKEIVAHELGYKVEHTLVLYNREAYEKENGSIDDLIKLDMEFDRTLPIYADITLAVNLNNQSLSGAAQFLTDAHQVFKKNGCHFHRYTLYSEGKDETLIQINFVSPEHIESGNLLSLLEKAANNKDNQEMENGISVYIKKPLAD